VERRKVRSEEVMREGKREERKSSKGKLGRNGKDVKMRKVI
jgi:hypothetical protein